MLSRLEKNHKLKSLESYEQGYQIHENIETKSNNRVNAMSFRKWGCKSIRDTQDVINIFNIELSCAINVCIIILMSIDSS